MGANDRAELAKLCCSKDWSKAIRILDSLLEQSCSIQDVCNRAFCYSQLELHKHVIKDCDKALQLDPSSVQPYILKGHALSALGRKEEALTVWRLGYGHAISHTSDIKQLLELEELLLNTKQIEAVVIGGGQVVDSCSSIKISNTSLVSSEIPNKSEGYKIDSKQKETLELSDTLKESIVKSKSSDTKNNKNEEKESTNFSQVFTKSNSMAKSISLDFRLSRGIAQVNEGKYDQAISLFNQILRENPTSPEALIGRGTAYAFQRELEAAITDFTMAIHSNPIAVEAWKRRGQARAASGDFLEAIKDLTKALEIEPNSPDILHERGIVNFKYKDYDAAAGDLSSCILHDKYNKSAYTYLGLVLANLGEYDKAENAHLKAIGLDKNFLDGWAHLVQFYKDMADLQKALKTVDDVLDIDKRFSKAYYLRGMLFHGSGRHRNAAQDLSVALSIESTNIECLYFRASCYHAIGEFGDAIKDYDAVLELELDSMEKFVIQCLAFYQKEIALYTASKVNSEFWVFDIDGDIDPLFKEYWCKRLHPKDVCEKVYRQNPLRDSLKKGRLRQQDFSVTKQKTILLQAADSIGKRIQYNCSGFLQNVRQHRMAGLAAIEIAQRVSKVWRELQAEWKNSTKATNKNSKKGRRREKINSSSQNRGGGGCSTSSPSDVSTSYPFSGDQSPSRSQMPWQDIYSIAVRWRQISEPCDPVVWVNRLSEEFNSGFGSHTPMLLGQSKVVRYYPNYDRAVNIAKTIMADRMYANNAEDRKIDLSESKMLQNLKSARSCSELHDVVGENFWIGTTCSSTAIEGKLLEGTRITTQKMDQRGYEFAIRTPCTPSRWTDYEVEMAAAWESLCNSYCSETYNSHDLESLEETKDCILRMAYYWYNFMPLSRGTAVVGYVVLLGLFLAANMEVKGDIPPGVQVDWEAILSSHPNAFRDSIKKWLYPSLRIYTAWKDLPGVASTFLTTGSVIAALSTYNN